MKIEVVTIFPAMVRAMLQDGIVARAAERNIVDLLCVDLRDFADDAHRTVDDTPFGGGPGMVLKAEPFLRAVEQVRAERGHPDRVLVPSPQGARLTQARVRELSRLEHLTFLCGRYEGIDERVHEALDTEEVSLGDYVVSGGELPAMVMIDAVVRWLPGAVGDAGSVESDSFADGLLDYPHYTRPAQWRGREVPAVLLSGNHASIATWRRRQALARTAARRPELLAAAALLPGERAWLDAQGDSDRKEHDDDRN